MNTLRTKEIGSSIGASLQTDHERIRNGLLARITERRFRGKAKASSFGHAANVRHYVEIGMGDIERRFVLMDYEKNKQLKARMFTHKEVWRRNKVLRGSGFAWALCNK